MNDKIEELKEKYQKLIDNNDNYFVRIDNNRTCRLTEVDENHRNENITVVYIRNMYVRDIDYLIEIYRIEEFDKLFRHITRKESIEINKKREQERIERWKKRKENKTRKYRKTKVTIFERLYNPKSRKKFMEKYGKWLEL